MAKDRVIQYSFAIRSLEWTYLWMWYASRGKLKRSMIQKPPNKNNTVRKAWTPYSGSISYKNIIMKG